MTRTRSAVPAAVGQRGWLTDHWASGQQRVNGHDARPAGSHTAAEVQVPAGQLQLALQREGNQWPSNSIFGRKSQRQPAPQRDEDQ